MSDQTAAALAPLVLTVFVVMWLLIGALIAELSGWRALVRDFPGAAERPPGERIRNQVVGLGVTGEKGVTTLIPTDDGLYMYSHPLFRFRRPPVHVPWNAIRLTHEARFLWWHGWYFDLGGVTTIRVKQRAYEAIASHLAAHEAAAAVNGSGRRASSRT